MTMTTSTISSVANPKFVILEDDICYNNDDWGLWGVCFFNLETGKIETDTFGHGADWTGRRESIGLSEAVESGVVTIDTLLETMLNALPINIAESIKLIACNHSLANPISIPVKVTGGRKFKGDAILVFGEREHERYGLGAYQKNCWNYYPTVLDVTTGNFHRVNSFRYLTYNESVFADVRKTILEKIPHTIGEVVSMAHYWAYDMSYSACDRDYKYNLVDSYTRYAVNTEILPEVTAAITALREKELTEYETAMNAELPTLIDWVKIHTDKTEENDVLELAKHIYKKYHKMPNY